MSASPQWSSRPSTRLSPTTRTEAVCEMIKQYIIDNRLESGDFIPTESQLMEITGASRSAVREALKILQTLGIVEIRRGMGTSVAPPTMSSLTSQLLFISQRDFSNGYTSLLETMQLREFLEVGLVRAMCEVTDPDLSSARFAIARMYAEAADGDISPDTDRRFHVSLYGSVGNSLVEPLLGSFFDAYQEVKLAPAGSESALDSVRQHEAIVAAIEARDAEAAAHAVRAHFDTIRNRVNSRTLQSVSKAK